MHPHNLDATFEARKLLHITWTQIFCNILIKTLVIVINTNNI